MPRKVIHVLSKMEWMKNITQTAVMNIVHQRIFIFNLTFRMLDNNNNDINSCSRIVTVTFENVCCAAYETSSLI